MKTTRYFRNSMQAVLLATGILFAVTLNGQAHEGHGALPITVQVQDVLALAESASIDLGIRNTGSQALVLQAVHVEGAKLIGFTPVTLTPNQTTSLALSLMFEAGVPGIFTAVLDFGDLGQGPIIVTP